MEAPGKKAALYLRVSTDKQETEAQQNECGRYALANALPIFRTVIDTASGSISWRSRQLGTLVLDTVGLTDVIVYEHSRIGRDMVDALEFIRHCNDAGINVHVAKSKTVIRADIGGKVISTVMSLAAEIERDLLRSRTRDALKDRKRRIKEDGGFTSASGNFITKLGRPPGEKGSTKLDQFKADIQKLFDAKVSDNAIARMYQCDRRTVRKMRTTYQKEAKK